MTQLLVSLDVSLLNLDDLTTLRAEIEAEWLVRHPAIQELDEYEKALVRHDFTIAAIRFYRERTKQGEHKVSLRVAKDVCDSYKGACVAMGCFIERKR